MKIVNFVVLITLLFLWQGIAFAGNPGPGPGPAPAPTSVPFLAPWINVIIAIIIGLLILRRK